MSAGVVSSPWRSVLHDGGRRNATSSRRRARSDQVTLAERMEEAIALDVLTVAEIARDARDPDDLVARLSRQERSPSLKARWESLHGR